MRITNTPGRCAASEGAVSGGDARLRSFDPGGMVLSNFRILVGPVSLPSVDGKPIEGLLGADFLGDYEIDLDLAHRRIILYAPPPCPIAAPAWSGNYGPFRQTAHCTIGCFFRYSSMSIRWRR